MSTDINANYPWVPFYEAVADKLLEYKSRDGRKELSKIMADIADEVGLPGGINLFKVRINYNSAVKDMSENLVVLSDISPYTILFYLNSSTADKQRIKIASLIGARLKIDNSIIRPTEFPALPRMQLVNPGNLRWNCPQNPQLAPPDGEPWYNHPNESENKDIIWKQYELAIKFADGDKSVLAELKTLYNQIVAWKGVKDGLSKGMYFIRPESYMTMDGNSRKYITNELHINVSKDRLQADEYFELLEKLRSKFKQPNCLVHSFLDISYLAYSKNCSESEKRNYWMVGYNQGSTNNQWERFEDEGIWDGFVGVSDDTQIQRLKKIKPDDVLVLKSSYTKGSQHNTSAVKLFKLAIVDSVSEISENNSYGVRCNVDYIDVAPKEFVNFEGSYRKTIDPLVDQNILEFVKSVLEPSCGNTEMSSTTSELATRYAEFLKRSRNLILTGAPGTGKTYLARKIAEAMNQGVELSDEDRKNTVGFVQFHPSYDYVDFVEGLRPDRSGDNVVFKREDGIFKKFCKRAIEKSKSTGTDWADNFDAAWNRMMDEAFKQNEILTIERPQSIMYLRPYYKSNNKEYRRKGFCNGQLDENGDWIPYDGQFFNKTQCYDLYRKVPQKYKSNGGNHYRRAIIDYMKEHCGLEDYQPGDTSHSQTINYVFIIDEINRGDLSKIFGELFFAIDPGYRVKEGEDPASKCVHTQYEGMLEDDDVFKAGFYVPDNVYIIGTMNDIDRSVESMDFALRRRFAWQKIKPEDTAESMGITGEVRQRMDAMNKAICSIPELGEDYQIGGAYFLRMVKENLTAEELWQFHLESLIDEYLRGLPNKDELYKKIKNAYDNPRKSNDETKTQENSAED